MNVPRSELPHVPTPQIEELQRARDYMSEQASQRELESLDRVIRPSDLYSPFKHLNTDGIKVYGSGAALGSLFAMDAMGIQTQVVLDNYRVNPERCDQAVTRAEFHGSRIGVFREGYETYYTREAVGETKDDHFITHLEQALGERMLESPAHRALDRALRRTERNDRLQTEEFDYLHDPLGTLACFQSLGLVRDMDHQMQGRVATGLSADHVNDMLSTGLNYGVTVTQKDGYRTFRWLSQNRAITKTLVIDDSTDLATFTARKSAPLVYLEKANQSEARSLPFVDSECARDMSQLLDSAGLTFSPELQAQMIDVGQADRYGSIYTRMSREIAKWINDPKRVRVSALFALKQPETEPMHIAQRTAEQGGWYASEDELAEDESAVREQLLQAVMPSNSGEAAAVLVSMAREAISRRSTDSDLPVTNDRIHITNGACFDVVAYYMGAAEHTINRVEQGLTNVAVDAVQLLEKTHGSHTYLTKDTIRFHGVRIPKGSLMQHAEDGGWALLRLTPFSFDNPKDQLAFGSEISKALENESRAIQRVGDISLAGLMKIDK